MSGVPRTRLIFSWIMEGFWFILYLLQLPLLIVPRWVHKGRRKEPVLILTDFGCSVFFYFRLRAALVRKGFSVAVISTGHLSSLAVQARKLAAILEQLNAQKAVLIAPGKSGLVALALPDSGRRRIQHLATLGAPFHGSRLHLALGFIPAFRDMIVGSEFLLLHRMNALLFPGFSPFMAYRDEWIYPANLAQFGQGRDLILDRAGHWNLCLDGENVETIVSHIDSAHAEPAPATPAAPVKPAQTPQVKSQPANAPKPVKRAPKKAHKPAAKKAKSKKKRK